MTEEPQRPIEAELKAWAKSRRDGEGAPFELHPATRRLLHNEVALVHPQTPQEELPTEAEPVAGFWARWWRPLAVGATFLFAVFLILKVYGPGSQEGDFQLAKATADEDRAAFAPPGDETTQRAQEVMTRARKQSEAQAQSAQSEFADQRAIELTFANDPAARAGATTQRDNKEIVTAVPSSRAAMPVPSAATAESSKSDAFATGPTTGKVSVLKLQSEPAQPPPARMSLDIPSGEVSAREAELAIVANGLRQSNDEMNREIEEIRRQQNPSGGATVTASVSVDAKKAKGMRSAAASEEKKSAVVLATASPAEMSKPTGVTLEDAPAAPIALQQMPQSITDLSIRQGYSQGLGQVQFRRNFNSPPPVNVLQNFQFQNTGRALRIVDEDGSVYTGALENDASQISNITQFPFSAIGLNRTLDQQVRFNGVLEVAPEGQTRVRGRASVGIRTELEVNARPAPEQP